MQLPKATAIHEASLRIAGRIRRTPVGQVSGASLGVPQLDNVFLKLEYIQNSGSFKARGATNFILSNDIGSAGVVAASGGNHGAAVAWAAREMGHKATIFVPTISSAAKVERLHFYDADVHQVGDVYAEALEASHEFQASSGAVPIHAYNHPDVLAGAGTTGLEFLDQAGALDTILVACGGGGLAGGMSIVTGDRCRLVVCEAENTSAFAAAKAAGERVPVEVSGITADALGATTIGELAWQALSKVDAVSVLMTDDEVCDAMDHLWDEFRIVVEPAAATAAAALFSGNYKPAEGERVGVVLCGANTPL